MEVSRPEIKALDPGVLAAYDDKNNPKGTAGMITLLKANPGLVESGVKAILARDMVVKSASGILYRVVLGAGTNTGTSKKRKAEFVLQAGVQGAVVSMEETEMAFSQTEMAFPDLQPLRSLQPDPQPLLSSQPDSADSQPPSPDIGMQITLGNAAETAIREALKGKQVRRACYVPPDLASNPWIMYHTPWSPTSACYPCRGRTPRSTSRPR